VNRIAGAKQELEVTIGDVDAHVQMMEGEKKKIDEEWRRYCEEVQLCTQTIDTAKARIAELQDASLKERSRAEYNTSLAIRDAYDGCAGKANKLREKVAVLNARLKESINHMTSRAAELDRVRVRLKGSANTAQADAAASALKEHNTAVVKKSGLDATIAQLSKQLDGLNVTYARNEAEQRRMEGVRKARNFYERARNLLHRDSLPNMVARGYMKALNDLLARYLGLFKVPFGARMLDDTSVMCTFGSHEVPAERLSGGQRVALGLTWRFAVHNLFVDRLGLLVLDEPTVFLDSDRINSVVDLLLNIREYVKKTNLQLLVVTHEDRLRPVFDQVIEH
jgi:exonuclease SbcC